MPLPVDPRIEAALIGARGTVAAANARRQQAAILAALGLEGSGLIERVSSAEATRAGAGFAEAPELSNVTYRLVMGPQGRTYRQAFMGVDNAAAERGGGGSARENQRLFAQRDLDAQVQSALRGFDTGQAESLLGQTQDLDQLAAQIGSFRFEQAREQAALPGQGGAPSAGMSPNDPAGTPPLGRRLIPINAMGEAAFVRRANPGYLLKRRGPRAPTSHVLVRR